MRRYERKSVEVGVFRRGWVTLNADFRGKEALPTNHCWYQSSRVTALSCGIKISAVRHLVLSQCTRVTDGRTDVQNYDSQDRPRICSRVKTHVGNLGYPLPLQIGGRKLPFWTTSQLNGKSNGLYLQKETRYRQSVKGVDNYKGSPTSSRNVTNFGPQTASNSTYIFTHPP